MPISHEEVTNLPRLPIKFFNRGGGTPRTPTHWHAGIELDYLVTGHDLNVVVSGTTYHYHQGDLWGIDRRQIHAATGQSKQNYQVIGLIIDDNFLTSQFPSSRHWNLEMLNLTDSPAVTTLKQHLVKINHLVQAGLTDTNRALILSELYQLLVLLDQNFVSDKKNAEPASEQSLADTVIAYIAQHSSEPLTAQSIANYFSTSQMTINKELKPVTKLSLGRYLRLVRLMHARQMLLSTNYPISYIADHCGFSSSKVFNRNFQAWKQKTPSQYRQAFAQSFHGE